MGGKLSSEQKIQTMIFRETATVDRGVGGPSWGMRPIIRSIKGEKKVKVRRVTNAGGQKGPNGKTVLNTGIYNRTRVTEVPQCQSFSEESKAGSANNGDGGVCGRRKTNSNQELIRKQGGD